MPSSPTKKSLWQNQRLTYWESFQTLFGAVVLLFIIEAVDQLFFGNRLFLYGVRQGDFAHWYRMFFAPFLHDGWAHVTGNAVGLLFLGSIVLLLGFRTLLIVTAFAVITAGVGILFFGKAGVHAGASSVVYGYFAYLVARGVYEKSWRAVLLSVAVLLVFQGMLFGLLPNTGHQVSWIGHLFGALGGITAAGTLAKDKKASPSLPAPPPPK
jgi:membrane associated rhomboid family serine protease